MQPKDSSARPLWKRALKWLSYPIWIAVTILLTIVVVYALQARARLPDLKAWHQVELKNEFRRDQVGAPTTFVEYLALEKKLFAEVRERVVDNASDADSSPLSRYNPKSVVAQLALDTPYNHSFEIAPTGQPRGSVLLVHGLSDSPYSVRGLGETFAAQGYYVVALRLPGHGTLPSGLLDVTWEDWYAAVVLAAKHAVAHGGEGNPFIACGHSTGAALVTLYSLRALQDPSLPKPQQLHLVSAAIGISPFAVLTNVLADLSFVPGFEKAKWMDVLPEYDPYKFNSFPVNAAKQIYKLTVNVQSTLDTLTPEQLAKMPRVHMYQSIVDSTVTANQVIYGLLARLPAKDHELFVFDINRSAKIEGLIAPGPLVDLERLRAAINLPFRITVISNRNPETREMAAFSREAGASEVTIRELPFEWPTGVFSVGHVSLPFPIDDPVYGLTFKATSNYNLGAVEAKGESGALVVGLGEFARLRSNPFFDVIKSNVVATLDQRPSTQ
jgi:alpha-beta hydrolase superfamily lysophospholipase